MPINTDSPTVPGPVPRRFVFVLLDQFAFLAFGSAVEPLRVANRVGRRALYVWSVVSVDGQPVRCSHGSSVAVSSALPRLDATDTAVVCAGLEAEQACHPALMDWLRASAAVGAILGGVCTGAHVLARAGLLEGRTVALHRDDGDRFEDQFPHVRPGPALHVIDADRITAAGGTAALDLMLALIAADHGPDLAAAVAAQLNSPRARAQTTHRQSAPANRRLDAVVARMHATVAAPLSPAALAAEVGLSPRQLERLFQRQFGHSPKHHSILMRLDHAREMLRGTDLPVAAVGRACGFASASHFAKCFRAEYGVAPHHLRSNPASGASRDLKRDDSRKNDAELSVQS